MQDDIAHNDNMQSKTKYSDKHQNVILMNITLMYNDIQMNDTGEQHSAK